MNRPRGVAQAVLAAIFLFSKLAIAAHQSPRGVVVEGVALHSESQKAGLHQGDVLDSWSRGDSRGLIASPFDIAWIEMEQCPRGAVTLEGQRQGTRRVWIIGPDRWGLQTRPELPGDILKAYYHARLLVGAGRGAAAAEGWKRAVSASSEIRSGWLVPWWMARAASILADARKWNEADAAFASALQESSSSDPQLAVITRAWAATYQQRSDWANAEKYYQQSIAASQRSQDNGFLIASNLDDLGAIALRRGDLVRAEQYCRQALTIRTTLAPDSLPTARSLNSIGTVTRFTRTELASAEGYYQRALALATKIAPDRLDVASTLNNLGIVSWYRGDLDQAERLVHRALSIRERQAPGSLDVAGSYNELGTVADLQGDFGKAESYYRKSLGLRQRLAPDSLLVADTVHNLGGVAEERGSLTKADRYYQQELGISERLEPDSLDMAGTYNNLGYVARDRHNWTKVKEYQQRALEIETRLAPNSLWVAETLHNLGAAAEAQGDLVAAERNYRDALAIRERLASGSKDHAETLVALASVLRRQGQMQGAERVYEQSLHALEQQADHLGGSNEVRSDFRARHATYYKDFEDLLLAENRPDAALEVLERSRARMLLEMMTAAHLDIRSGVDPNLLTQKQSLEAEISAKSAKRIRLLNAEHTDEQVAQVKSEINDLLKQHEDVEDQIRLRSPNYASLVQPKPLSTKQIQSELIDADTLLVEYSLGEERSHVFLASSDHVDSYDIPKRSEIEAAARSMYNHLTASNRVVKGETGVQRSSRLDREQASYERAALALSQMILTPIASRLGRKRLLIVSDGALHYIPFAALPVSYQEETGRAGVVPLVADHEIVNLPSASVLAVLRREEMSRQKPPKAVAVLADPVFDRQDSRVRIRRDSDREPRPMVTDPTRFRSVSISRLQRSIADVRSAQSGGHGAARDLHLGRLWFTRLEADRILAVTPQGQGIKAVDFDASRSKATSPELATYRIVHFATHGLLDSQNPELSGLVFSMVDANGHVQDGFLDLQDIYNLNLPADMVVLSACETGLGKEIDGEGMIGLTRGFMYAGATRVVASLWRVSDVATAELMARFYRAMEQDGMRPAAALRMAQIQMWKQNRWTMPYYWAAFQIHGEWN